MNRFYITIDGEMYYNSVFPFKYGEFLDEQLDYATVTLSRIDKEIFKPFTQVCVEIRDEGSSIKKYYRISNDSARESPVGSGFYWHDLTLIEETKYLEGFMVESLCMTNASGKRYKRVYPTVENVEFAYYDYPNKMPQNYLLTEDFKTPCPNQTLLVLPSCVYVYRELLDFTPDELGTCDIEVTVMYADATTQTFSYHGNDAYASPGSFYLKTGLNKIARLETAKAV